MYVTLRPETDHVSTCLYVVNSDCLNANNNVLFFKKSIQDFWKFEINEH